MAGKLLIQCDLVTVTGMHIGGSDTFSAIGAIDSPVIRDAYTGRPIVPGSSLKGKLRALLARNLSKDMENMPDFSEEDEKIQRVFGSANPIRMARAQFSDSFIINYDQMKHVGLTEAKAENVIRRSDAVANPRQIERLIPGVKFGVRITYNVVDDVQTREDLELLAKGMKILQMDYLGGHGSRGSGRVSLRNFRITDENDVKMPGLENIFGAVSAYELFPDQVEV